MKKFLHLMAGLWLDQPSAFSNRPSGLSNQSSALNRRLPTQYLLSPNTYKRIPLILFILVFVSCGAALAQEPVGHTAPAAKAETEITPLKIGDKVPDELWEQHFPVINGTNNQIQYINLGEFRDKVIVLDFWATWCGSCISAMPHLEKLQKEFQDDLLIIPITYEKADKVQEFLKNSKSPIINSLKESFHSVVDDRYLRSHFEFKSIPQIIVITNGKVKTLTMPSMLNQENLAAMIKGEEAYIAKERFGELEKPLLKLAFDDVKTQKPLYYSAITGYMDGVINAARQEKDSLDNVQRYYQTSLPIVHLYSVTSQFRDMAINPKRRILEVSDPSKYVNYLKSDGTSAGTDIDWIRKNTFNYEIIFPLSIPVGVMKKRFKEDLDFYFSLHGRLENRVIPVWVLKSNLIKSNKIKVSDNMLYRINNIETIPLVINEVVEGETLDLIIPHDFTIQSLRLLLNEHGLDLIEEKREVEMFVLTENNYEPNSGKLVISPYGYIFK